MVGFWIRGGQGVIKAIKPFKKIKGQRTVQEQKNLTSQKQFKSALEKFGKTVKKQKKILED